MTELGSESNPLRVAIIGSGPAGFYAADHLFKQRELLVKVDMFDRLPTPFGLVRYGVAPDHLKIKSVTKLYDRIAANPNLLFFGNVEFGEHFNLSDLRQHYHQIIYSTGTQSDRRMGIPGEDLIGSHPATEFVAWYNGHPNYCDYRFDLTQERVVVVGIGNVAVDVARILCLTPDELQRTDMADYAIDALSESNIKEVFVLGRRGPAQAAFTNPEAKELGELAGADIHVLPKEAELDDLSRVSIERGADRNVTKKVEIIQSYARRRPTGKARKLTVRFLVSPVELMGDSDGRVVGVQLQGNELYETESDTLRPRPTEQFEELSAGLVFRSVGYRGVPIPGVPFNESWGVILNEKGRVLNPESQKPLVGQYTSGWVKRGPTGVIGTNKADSVETVTCMLEDLANRITLNPQAFSGDSWIRELQPDYFSYADWQQLDKLELANGTASGRPRVKFTSVDDMLAVLRP